MKSATRKSVHSTRAKDFNKLTKKEHIGRELELWGIITGLQIKLRAARKKIRVLSQGLKDTLRVGPKLVMRKKGAH